MHINTIENERARNLTERVLRGRPVAEGDDAEVGGESRSDGEFDSYQAVVMRTGSRLECCGRTAGDDLWKKRRQSRRHPRALGRKAAVSRRGSDDDPSGAVFRGQSEGTGKRCASLQKQSVARL